MLSDSWLSWSCLSSLLITLSMFEFLSCTPSCVQRAEKEAGTKHLTHIALRGDLALERGQLLAQLPDSQLGRALGQLQRRLFGRHVLEGSATPLQKCSIRFREA